MKASGHFARLMVILAMLAGHFSYAMVYHVEIKDLDPLQPLTPPVAIVHDSGYEIFAVGEASTPGLEAVAEEGNPEILVEEASADPHVKSVVVGGAGGNFFGAKFYVIGEPGDLLSIASMFARTNDNFIGLSSMPLPSSNDPVVMQFEAYDAGTEVNTGLASDVPFYGGHEGPDEGGVVQVANQYAIVDDPDMGVIEFNWPPSAMITITPMPDAIAYHIKMTNESEGQALSPSSVILHDSSVEVFTEGEAANDGVELLAESGSSKTIINEITSWDGVYQATSIGTGGGMEQMGVAYGVPGEKVTIISMFVRTNDIFTGVKSMTLPPNGETMTVETTTWDAGTEVNTGLTADVPFYGGLEGSEENGVVSVISDYAIMDDPDEGIVEFHWPPSAKLEITGMGATSNVNDWNMYQ